MHFAKQLEMDNNKLQFFLNYFQCQTQLIIYVNKNNMFLSIS